MVHRWYINVSSLYRFQAQKRYVIYSFIHVPILYQIGHISDIFGNPVQNRYTFFVPVKMYQFCTFFRCGKQPKLLLGGIFIINHYLLKVGSWTFEGIIILLIYFLNCQKHILQRIK